MSARARRPGIGMPLRIAILLARLPLATPAADVDPDTGLVIQPGWEDVRVHCGTCHSLGLVTHQRADRATWLDMIRWMQATQNLWSFEPDTESRILDYLADNYPPRGDYRRPPLPPDLMPR